MDLDTLKKDRPDICQSLMAEGIQSERQRISTILQHDEAKERQTLAQHLALNTDLSPDIVAVALSHAGKPKPVSESQPTNTPTPESISGFSQVMAGIENPDIQPGGDDANGDDETPEKIAARIAGYSKLTSVQGAS